MIDRKQFFKHWHSIMKYMNEHHSRQEVEDVRSLFRKLNNQRLKEQKNG